MTGTDPQARIALLERELQWALLKIQVLEERLRQQRIKMLGPRSETLSDLQLELLAEEEPGVTGEEVEAESRREPITQAPRREGKPPRRAHPGRQRLPDNLPRVEQVIACANRQCTKCGAETAVLGYDQSEQLDVEPARYFVRVIKREKRACRKCVDSTVMAAPLPERIVELSRRIRVPTKARSAHGPRRPVVTPSLLCAGYSGPGIAGTMPGSGLFRVRKAWADLAGA